MDMDRTYYKAMIGVITILMTICTYFIIGIFHKVDNTHDYMVAHKIEFNQLQKEVEKIHEYILTKPNPKIVQR